MGKNVRAAAAEVTASPRAAVAAIDVGELAADEVERAYLAGAADALESVAGPKCRNTKRSAKQFARGQRGGILTTSMPASVSTGSSEAVNCPARSRTWNRTARCARGGL